MTKLKYCYKTGITFTERVHSHYFLLRMLPFENEAQHVVENRFHISPEGEIVHGVDVFGNQIITGYVDAFHDSFEFLSEGIVETNYYKLNESLNRIYLYPSKLTRPNPQIQEMSSRLRLPVQVSATSRVEIISDAIASALKYEPQVTGIHTSASEALSLGCGVCQDFSHLLISLCRLNDIPARYVSGFMEGEGFTHAWVEYFSEGCWYAFDPTHNRKVETAYIKIAQGRDYADCPLDKGVFRGVALQQLEVYVKAEQEVAQQ